jgi:tRNA dimethylallyltransferase
MSKTASEAVGYKELIKLFRENGRSDQNIKSAIKAAKILIKRNTRRLAKRQWTWFKKEPGVQWVDLSAERPLSTAANDVSKIIYLFQST